MSENLNEMVEVIVQDASVITVPIDDTLSNSGEAADAKAVGDALDLKADRSELQTAVTVNGQAADAQGKIIVTAADTKMSSSDNTTVKAKIEAVDGKTAADLVAAAIRGMSGPGEIVCGPELARALAANLAALGSFTVTTDESAGAGFSVKVDGGRVESAFTADVVAGELAKRLRPDLAALLK